MSPARFLTDATAKTLGWILRRRRCHIESNRTTVKLNLGCGLTVAPEWINVDGSLNAAFAAWPIHIHRLLYKLSGSSQYYEFDEYHAILSSSRFVFHNLEYGIPFPDRCADAVYSSHFLEHLARQHGRGFLREAYRVLKPQGILRISVPDLAFAVSLYGTDTARMLDSYFFVEDRGSYFARHKYMYDFELLKVQLNSIGFSDIQRCGFRRGELPDVDLLDNREEDSLFVEAVRKEQ